MGDGTCAPRRRISTISTLVRGTASPTAGASIRPWEEEKRSFGSPTLPLSPIDRQRIALDLLLVKHSKEALHAQSVTTPAKV